jgi:hypothetical protein
MRDRPRQQTIHLPQFIRIQSIQAIAGSRIMKKVLLTSAVTLLAVVVLGGLGAVYFILSSQDRGTSADGRMAPPASVRNAPEAPKYDATKAAPAAAVEKPPEYQLPTNFKLPTEMDITTPPVPEGLSAPAGGQKS